MAEPEYDIMDDTEHIRVKDMYLGSKEIQSIEDFIMKDGKVVRENVEYSPAFKTCFDEILVNAIDHYTRHRNQELVKEIKVTLSEDGEISVYNDGPGIPVKIHEKLNFIFPN